MRLRAVASAPWRLPPKRNIEIVAQPPRQRHVPTAPEIADAERAIGLIEILRKAIAEQRRDADRDVGVGAEIGVDLDRVGVDRDDQIEARELRRVGEDGIDEAHREIVGDHHLLEQAAEDQQHVLAEGEIAGSRRRSELRQELVRAHDRPGDEMREETDVEHDVERRARGRQAPAIDVDDVGNRVKGQERDRHRQGDVDEADRRVQPQRMGERENLRDEEVEIFEIA